jgi:Spy/CpxP family protein refolding chaperone
MEFLTPDEASPLKQEKKTIQMAISVAIVYLLVSLAGNSPAWAQGPHDGGPPHGDCGGPDMPPGGGPCGGPNDRHSPPPGGPGDGTQSTLRGGLQLGPPGRWWDDERFAWSLDLSGDQKKRMDAIFAENKGTLLNLFHSLEAEEAGLERLTIGTHLDEQQIFRQIDKVTEARAALEKANVHMLLGIRKQMTDEQTEKLDEHRPTGQRRGPPPRQPNDFDKPNGEK